VRERETDLQKRETLIKLREIEIEREKKRKERKSSVPSKERRFLKLFSFLEMNDRRRRDFSSTDHLG
jgi:hypothetical protein